MNVTGNLAVLVTVLRWSFSYYLLLSSVLSPTSFLYFGPFYDFEILRKYSKYPSMKSLFTESSLYLMAVFGLESIFYKLDEKQEVRSVFRKRRERRVIRFYLNISPRPSGSKIYFAIDNSTAVLWKTFRPKFSRWGLHIVANWIIGFWYNIKKEIVCAQFEKL